MADVHRPEIDEVTLPCPGCGGHMRRTSEVLDCWFDSGCMPFAQHHYPFENQDSFAAQFPADFICEAVDQTRGWFYSLLAVNVGLFGQAPYRRVLVTEFGLDDRGKKMSKSRRNVVDLGEVLDQNGADALRLYVYSSGQPWVPKRISKAAVSEVGRVLETLGNVLSFQALYAGLDGWKPEPVPADGLTLLDRWLLSRLQGVTAGVKEHLLGYDVPAAARLLIDWVDDLSNWYVRLSRRRFWNGGAEGRPAFATLHHALCQTALLMAPFTPFLAESLCQELQPGESAHLRRFPDLDAALVDEDLERKMALVRRYVSAGRGARQAAGLKVRQPLATALLLGWPEGEGPGELADLLAAELNVKRVERTESLPEGFMVGEEGGCRTAVDGRLTPDLLQEGLAREVVNRLQRFRKELGLAVEDRVHLWLDGTPSLVEAVRAYAGYVTGEVQAVAFHLAEGFPPGASPLEAAFEGERMTAVIAEEGGQLPEKMKGKE